MIPNGGVCSGCSGVGLRLKGFLMIAPLVAGHGPWACDSMAIRILIWPKCREGTKKRPTLSGFVQSENLKNVPMSCRPIHYISLYLIMRVTNVQPWGTNSHWQQGCDSEFHRLIYPAIGRIGRCLTAQGVEGPNELTASGGDFFASHYHHRGYPYPKLRALWKETV